MSWLRRLKCWAGLHMWQRVYKSECLTIVAVPYPEVIEWLTRSNFKHVADECGHCGYRRSINAGHEAAAT